MLTHEDLDLSLKEFIASPQSVDSLSDAVPVCAPWSALARYKYKAKLAPGSTKKGKAARSIVSSFLAMPVDEQGEDPEKISPREKELLQSLKGTYLWYRRSHRIDEDVIPCIWPKSVKTVGGKSDSSKTAKKATPGKGKGRK